MSVRFLDVEVHKSYPEWLQGIFISENESIKIAYQSQLRITEKQVSTIELPAVADAREGHVTFAPSLASVSRDLVCFHISSLGQNGSPRTLIFLVSLDVCWETIREITKKDKELEFQILPVNSPIKSKFDGFFKFDSPINIKDLEIDIDGVLAVNYSEKIIESSQEDESIDQAA